MPQLVLEARYFSHRDMGVDIGVSISLRGLAQDSSGRTSISAIPMAAFYIVIVSPEPTPSTTKVLIALIEGKLRAEDDAMVGRRGVRSRERR